MIPANADVLDIGCGNGLIAHLIESAKPTIRVRGLEVKRRSSAYIECLPFDGSTIPLRDSSVDVCMFVDVLHHTLNIAGLLAEARRVTRRYILVKDHISSGLHDRVVLSFMDWIGNRPHGVVLPYNYQSRKSWELIFSACALQVAAWTEKVPLYPWPCSWLFGRDMHYIALLDKT